MSTTNDFEGAFLAITGRMVEGARQGMGLAVNQLMDDAINELNRVPLEEGTLRGSVAAFVDGQRVGVAPNVGGNPTPPTEDPAGAAPNADEIRGTVAFKNEYAAFQHEGQREDGSHKVENYSHAGTGTKFLEGKVSGNRDDYLQTVADAATKAADRG